MTNETEHAALPWEHCGINGIHKRVSSHYATCIATTVGDNREADARYIVKAANYHYRLVKALDRLLDMWGGPLYMEWEEARALLAELETLKD